MSTLDDLTRVQDSPPSNDAEKVVWIERSLLVLLFAGLLSGVLEVLNASLLSPVSREWVQPFSR